MQDTPHADSGSNDVSGLSKDQVTDALRLVKDAETGRNIVENGQLQKVAACGDDVSVTIAAPDNRDTREGLRGIIEQAVQRKAKDEGTTAERVTVQFITASAEGSVDLTNQPKDIPLKQASSSPTVTSGTVQAGQGQSSGPKASHVIAVGAGKGGVGKSTVSVNLAVGLARAGHRVGLLDGDIYGPSAPTMLGLGDRQAQVREGMLQVFTSHGIKSMTIGKLVDPEKPLIWRGPMAHGAFKQLVEQTEWGELDYLIVDLPPGTGDVPLSMSQMFSLSGAVVVCTPQKVAQDDAVRAVRMFQQLKIPVLGIVENMSYFVGDDGKEYDIFGRGGAEKMAQRLGLPMLGSVPINTALRANSDGGEPTLNFSDDVSEVAGDEASDAARPGGPQLKQSLEKLVRNIENEVALSALQQGGAAPTLSVS